jgi:hypothetical protein
VIYMTWEEQDRADHTPRRWAIAPGHTPRGGVHWRVIEETDRFVIVEIDGMEPGFAARSTAVCSCETRRERCGVV